MRYEVIKVTPECAEIVSRHHVGRAARKSAAKAPRGIPPCEGFVIIRDFLNAASYHLAGRGTFGRCTFPYWALARIDDMDRRADR